MEVRGEASLILVQPSWRGRESSGQVLGARPVARSGPPQAFVARSQSPIRGRPRAANHSPVRGRHPSPSRPPRDASPIRPVHQRKAPPYRQMQHARERSESPVSPRERFQDAREKFRSLEREWQRPDRQDLSTRSHPHADITRTPSWEPSPKPQGGARDFRSPVEQLQAGRDEGLWPKSDRDTGYGSRDGLLRERPRGRDCDRGYGTCDTRDSDPWRREVGRRTPDLWQKEPRASSPSRVGRGRSPSREYRVPRVRSPERPDYQRAKSMHDLSQRRLAHEEDRRALNDPRRRSMYDAAEDSRPLRESRSGRRYRSHASIRRRSSSCSSESCHSVDSYNEIPDARRFPGLDRATARPDPLDQPRLMAQAKRTFDYPVNGGTAAVHISRAHHDDYRRFRYDHTTTPQFIRSTSVPSTQY
ncbi:serine/arginine repetitive matrix protein 1-like [Penaeus indicus]|uniref:serine/arginine repetitive matrix protein 1-like n=1 Tax=Penaeus indicus TaxID=29960 RepID=UPI00300DA1B3